MSLVVGDAAPEGQLLDSSGNSLRLASLWQQQPLVLLFIRHFG